MTAQFILSMLLSAVLLYAWAEYRRSPAVAVLAVVAGTAGLYFVWFPAHSTQLAELVGIGRGVDLIIYVWVCISLIVLLNLHLKLRTQMELITTLARKVALAEASAPTSEGSSSGGSPASAPGHRPSRVCPGGFDR
jgi:small membrane protein